jgi:CRISPR-associated endonuclease Csn1
VYSVKTASLISVCAASTRQRPPKKANRLTRRRAWRLTKLSRLLKREGLIAEIAQLRGFTGMAKSPWQLRVEGLDRKLLPEEWARVLYHLVKHRGFHWISKAEEKKADGDAKGEGGKVKQGLAGTKKLMAEKQYRSAAEMVLAEFPEAQRNKQGEYSKALSRVLLSEELTLLFKRQRSFGNAHATFEIESAILGAADRRGGLFWEQKPPLSGSDLLKMLGQCTFDKGEYRAPKASFTAERHVWLTRLNNLRIVVAGDSRPLNEAERQIALPLPYQQVGDLTYKQLRAALLKAGLLPGHFKFAGLRYPTQQEAEQKAKDPESERLVNLPGWQELRKTLKDKGLETEWQGMAGAAISGRPELLDQISWVLSVFKDGSEVERELRKLLLPGGEAMIDALSEISFDKFHALSLKALRKIVPEMETGLRYDEACEKAGYHHSQLFKSGEGQHEYLPPFYEKRDKGGRMVFIEDADIPRNPVVLRSLNQARKVLNALVRKYGSPAAVHIEMARDLSRPMDERNKVKKAQEEFRDRNDIVRKKFVDTFGFTPSGKQFEQYMLYEEQQCKCAYSLEPLDIGRVLHEPGYAEVDHALPYSRSFDDSKNNKVLVLCAENRNKGNRTPYEYLTSFDGGENGIRWRNYVAFVEGNKSYRLAKRSRLLRKNFSKEESGEFKERNLNDTRYICKFFKNYVERHLKFAEGSDSKRCVVLSGQLTAFLRTRWGFNKVRGDSDRHHALDATVVATCSHALVKRLSDYSRRKELEHAGNVIDMETGEILNPVLLAQLERDFPRPWPHFREEVLLRLNMDDPALLKAEAERLGYPPEAIALLRPLFVSRAPQRRNGGAAHKDTIYAQPERLKTAGSVTQKVSLSSLSLKDLDKLMDPHRNEKLYAAIRTRLEANGGKGEKAFPFDNPLRKPDRDGNPTGPVVRTVTMVIGKLSGIPVRGGIAKNDTMLRVDVFRHKKDGKYHLVPVYVHHAVAKELPNRAIVAFKDEEEWTPIDEQHFEFAFCLHPNDLVRVSLKGEILQGYYAGCDRSTGNMNLWVHDRNSLVGKEGFIRTGVKTAQCLEKLHVDTLGNIYPALPEKRRGLA